MNFLDLYWLWALLILLPGAWLLFRLGDRCRKRLLRAWLGGGAKTDLAPGKRALRRWLLAGAILFFALAAARPWWGEHLLDVPVAGGDVLAVFDVSKSMLAQDVPPSRLEHAKWLLRELVKSNPGDRFGIVAFAGRAFLACPLTSDQVSLDQCIAELEPALVPVGGTNLAEALRTALNALRAASGQRRTILLLTDGEELTGSVSELLAELKKQNVELLVAGFGDPAVPALIPEPGPDGHAFKRDRQGELVRTRLNEELLKKLAAATGGFYCNSTALHSGLEELNRRLRALPDGERHELRRTLPIDRFMGFLILGTVLLALWFVLGETQSAPRRRVMLFYLGVLGTLWGLPLPAQEEIAKVPPKAPPAQEMTPAETPAVKDPVTLYNEARTLQIDGKRAEAHRNYEEALAGGDAGAVREASMHNLGILSHQEARDTTAEALRTAQSGDLDAALQALGRAGQSLDKAEAWYLDALAGPDRPELRQTALAQQLLLKDREHLKQLKKQLEELKKKQEEARRKTQQAARQNQQQNQQQQGQQDQQKQDQQQGQQDQQKQDQQQGQQNQQKQDQQQGQQQQGQQDQQKQDQQQGQQGQQGQQKQDQQQGQQGQQKQDQQQGQQQQQQGQQQQGRQDQQQGQQQQDRKDPARQALDEARDAVDQMQKAAGQAGQKQMKEQAEQARKELDQAADKQQKQDYSGAQKHLDAAQQALGENPSGEKSDQDKNGKDGEKADKGKDGKEAQDGKEGKETPEGKEGKDGREGKDKPLPAMPEEGRQDEQKMDQQQADALLDLMSRDEEKLRDALKRQRNRAVRPVEKDW